MRTRAQLARPDVGLIAVFVLAVALRVAVVAHSRGGFGGNFGYDSSVYFSAADAIIHGRMPYADFTLLHPPALPLVLTPFAALGRITSDHTGFIAANTAFEVLGGVNAVLVVLAARRAGVNTTAALIGGIFYAAWPGSISAEISARLEPLGNFFLLCALLVLLGARRTDWSTRALIGCGALLGASAVTKIWWSVPLGIIIVWTAVTLRSRCWPMIAGAAAAMIVIAGPFAVYAPRAMWRMIVTDQLGRPPIRHFILTRIADIVSPGFTPTHAVEAVIVVLVGIAAVIAIIRAWRTPVFRPVVILALAQFAVLVAAPTYFGFYADFLAPAAALTLAAALVPGRATSPARHRLIAIACVTVVAASAVAELVATAPSEVSPFPGARLAAAAARAHVRCVMADSPMALIELDVLSPDLARGCPNRIDVSGSTYDRDRPPHGRTVARTRNRRWQRDLLHYLLSGNAEIVIRRATGISPATYRRLDRLPVIAEIHGKALRRTG